MLDDLYAVSLFPGRAGTMWRKFVAEVTSSLFAMSDGVDLPCSGTSGHGLAVGKLAEAEGRAA